MAIDGGGNVSEWSLRVIAAWLECFPEKSDWCRNEQVCQGRKSVKRFDRSNGLDTALYKNKPFSFMMMINYSCGSIVTCNLCSYKQSSHNRIFLEDTFWRNISQMTFIGTTLLHLGLHDHELRKKIGCV